MCALCSASEVTTLWRYANIIIIIVVVVVVIIISTDFNRHKDVNKQTMSPCITLKVVSGFVVSPHE